MSAYPAAEPVTAHATPMRTATLRGWALWLARVAWVVIAVSALGAFLIAVPARLDELAHPSATTDAALEALHLSAAAYAVINVTLDTVFVAVSAGVGWLIFWRRSDDRMALVVGLALATWGPFNSLLVETTYALDTLPGPGMLRVLDSALTYAGYMCWMLFFYLFPSGRFVPRWTRGFALAWVLFAGIWAVFGDDPPAPPSWPLPLFLAAVLTLWLSFPVAQVYRYRHASDPVQRRQTKWVVFGVAVAVGGLMVTMLTLGLVIDLRPEQVGRRLVSMALADGFMLAIPITIGITVLRYRLFDIDILINRTLVYGTLTACVVGLYVVAVGSLGALFQTGGNLAISLAATGMVAVLFQPLRVRLQRAVNRLLYGERDDPYAVLSRLGRRLESTLTPDTVLPAIVQTVKEALKLPYAAITLVSDRQGEATTLAAAAGTPVEAQLRLPLVYQHEPVGELVLAPRAAGEPFSAADRRLLDDLARQAGVAVHAVRLTADLQRSRERLVTAQEEERRWLRRDLHDGLGPALAGMTLQTEAARDLSATDPAKAEALLTELIEQLQAATADIRRLVYALRPPALDELGLVGALRAQAAHHDLGRTCINVQAPDALPPLPAAVEVAAYRITQEALTNVLRHAHAQGCAVTLACDDAKARLTVEIVDDGCGLPPDARAGVGLTSMRERAEELGGACVIEPMPTGGTRVRATLPCLHPDEVVPP